MFAVPVLIVLVLILVLSTDGGEDTSYFNKDALKVNIWKPLDSFSSVDGEHRWRWLHVPKTGTSFANTLVFWACPELPDKNLLVDQEISIDKLGEPLSASCQERIASKFLPGLDGPYMDTEFFLATQRSKRPRPPWENQGHLHVPLPSDITDNELRYTMSFFREPEKRIISHFYFNHPRLFTRTDHQGKLLQKDPNAICQWLLDNNYISMMTKMILGYHRFDSVTKQNLTLFDAADACDKVRALGFIGITDYWDASICLFHAEFGGEARSAEKINTRKNPTGVKQNQVKKIKDGLPRACRDELDGHVYSCALDEFFRRIRKHDHCARLLRSSMGSN